MRSLIKKILENNVIDYLVVVDEKTMRVDEQTVVIHVSC